MGLARLRSRRAGSRWRAPRSPTPIMRRCALRWSPWSARASARRSRCACSWAELEEAEHGDNGLWREWLARASRAALDPAWMARRHRLRRVGTCIAVHRPTRRISLASAGRASRPSDGCAAAPPRTTSGRCRTSEPAARCERASLPAQDPLHVAAEASEPEPIMPAPVATPSAVLAEPSPEPETVQTSPSAEPSLNDDHDKAASIMAMPSVPPGDELASAGSLQTVPSAATRERSAGRAPTVLYLGLGAQGCQRHGASAKTRRTQSAAIAQSVEHLIRNEGVGGSIPSCGTTLPC